MKLQPQSDGTMVLEGNYTVDVGSWFVVTVPSGFSFDGATIPRMAWSIIGHPFTGGYVEAALVHDYLCTLSHEQKSYTLRVIADAVFMHLLERAGVPYWRRALMYLAVRTWGRIGYEPNTKEKLGE